MRIEIEKKHGVYYIWELDMEGLRIGNDPLLSTNSALEVISWLAEEMELP